MWKNGSSQLLPATSECKTLGKSWDLFRRRNERERKLSKERGEVVLSSLVPTVSRTQFWEPDVKRGLHPYLLLTHLPQGQGYTQHKGFHSEHIEPDTSVCVQILWADLLRSKRHLPPSLSSHPPPRTAVQNPPACTSSRPQATAGSTAGEVDTDLQPRSSADTQKHMCSPHMLQANLN